MHIPMRFLHGSGLRTRADSDIGARSRYDQRFRRYRMKTSRWASTAVRRGDRPTPHTCATPWYTSIHAPDHQREWCDRPHVGGSTVHAHLVPVMHCASVVVASTAPTSSLGVHTSRCAHTSLHLRTSSRKWVMVWAPSRRGAIEPRPRWGVVVAQWRRPFARLVGARKSEKSKSLEVKSEPIFDNKISLESSQ